MVRDEDILVLNKLTNEKDEDLLRVLLEDAESFVLLYTGRYVVPDVLRKTVRDLALIAYNRLGTEGESGRSDGGESYNFNDAPKQIFDVLNRFRIARVGGVTHANQT